MPNQATLPPFPVQEGVEFRHIPGCLGLAVASTGCVWSCRGRRGYDSRWRQLSGCKDHLGYFRVCVRFRKSIAEPTHVHRLVLLGFIGPPPPGAEACHGNGDRGDNRIANLRWDTRRANHADMVRHGRKVILRGERNHLAKLTAAAVDDIRARCPVHGSRDAARRCAAEYGVTVQTIADIVTRRMWRREGEARPPSRVKHRVKLTEVAVKDIRTNCRPKVSGRDVLTFARKYGVDQKTIRNVLTRRTWRTNSRA